MSRIDEVKCNCQILLSNGSYVEICPADENSCWQHFPLVAAGGHMVIHLKKVDGLAHFTLGQVLRNYLIIQNSLALKINSTFYKKIYRVMTSSTFRRMASAMPDGFEFC
jgi:hypothetical protein